MSEDHEQRPLTGDSGGEEPATSDDGDGDGIEAAAEEAEEMPFEEAVEELEGIVEELEDGDLALEDAMDSFERGLGLVEACRSKLERAELKVEELLDDGSTEDLDEGA